MTIKEYLNFKIVGAKEALENAKGAEEQAYTEGVLDAWNLMEDILPSLEQELTIRELQEFCEAHECEDCPFARLAENEYGISDFCICIVRSIKNWDVDEIEKTIKEATTE